MDPSTATIIAIFVFIVIAIIVAIIFMVSAPVAAQAAAPATTAPADIGYPYQVGVAYSNCVQSAWGICDPNTKTQTRTITTQQSGKGTACGPVSQNCIPDIDCIQNAWGVCDPDTGTQTRLTITAQSGKGTACGPVSQSCGQNVNLQYLGCFRDANGDRVLKAEMGLKTLAQCESAAKAAGSKYFGLQYGEGGDGTTAECFHGSDAYDRLGTDKGCTNVGYPYYVGGNYSNAVYSVPISAPAAHPRDSCVSNILGGVCNTTIPSNNNKANLLMQDDGNVVLYSPNGPKWASNTNGKGVAPYRLVMQDDGNLVAYDSKNAPLWASNTNNKGTGPFRAVMQDDGNFVVYAGNQPTWASDTFF